MISSSPIQLSGVFLMARDDREPQSWSGKQMQLYAAVFMYSWTPVPISCIEYLHGRHSHNVGRGLHGPFHWGVPELLPLVALSHIRPFLAHPLPYSEPFPTH